MKNPILIGLIQMSMSSHRGENVKRAAQMIKGASERGAHIVCLPELFTTLYFPREEKIDASGLAETIPGKTTDSLAKAAQENHVVLIGGSIFEKEDGKFYNTSVVFDENGGMIGKYRKMHIPLDPFFYEKDYFEESKDGFKVFQTKYCKIGVLICYDQWFPEAARINALMGADMIFYPTAIGVPDGNEEIEGNWQEAWTIVQRGHAVANTVVVASVNRVGKEGNMNFFGGSFVSDQFGKILAQGGNKEEIIIAEIDLNLSKHIREGWRFFYNRRPESYSELIKRDKK
ncbi:MAG: carbon-nitrogen hydrolase [Nitrospinae bacterium]|nr:carbon-nitrogen hydrolase [Nitrospinota bacterium]